MSCDGLQSLNPICQTKQLAAQSADVAFGRMANNFGTAAQDATTWLWDQINTATTVDLHHLGDSKPLTATASVAVVLCLALFVLQVLTATLRQEPGGLGRAVKGLLISFLGTALALGTTTLLLAAVDSLSAGLVQYTMGTNLHGLGTRLSVANLSSVNNPAVMLLFAVVILGAVVVVWAALMIRKMMILIAAILAPLAFAGATADISRGWVRKWIEFVAAMIASKLLLVIILSVGVSVLDGYGQAGSGVTQTSTQLAAGTLILLLGGFAPWVAVRTFHFAGDSLYAAHVTAAGGTAGARTVIAAPQKMAALQWQARALAPRSHSSGPPAPPPRTDPRQLASSPPPSGSSSSPAPASSTAPGVGAANGSSTTAGGSLGTATAGGGTAAGGAATSTGAVGAAAAPVLIPAAIAAGSLAAGKAAVTATANTVGSATPVSPQPPAPTASAGGSAGTAAGPRPTAGRPSPVPRPDPGPPPETGSSPPPPPKAP